MPPAVTYTATPSDPLRALERVVTLLGVPLLMLVIGSVGATLWNDRAENATRDANITALHKNLESSETRLRERIDNTDKRTRDELAVARTNFDEAVRRGETARVEISRANAERDADMARQIAEHSAALSQARVTASVLTTEVAAIRVDLQEIKALLQQRPPPRAIDRLPPGGWAPSR